MFVKKHELPDRDYADPRCHDCGYSSPEGPYSGEMCPNCLTVVDWEGAYTIPENVICCRSYSMERLTAVPGCPTVGLGERVYLRLWEEENCRTSDWNFGVPLIWILKALAPREARHAERPSPPSLWHRAPQYERTNVLEERIAASVIQWLGTNVGQGFVHEAQRRIKQEEQKFRAQEDLIRR